MQLDVVLISPYPAPGRTHGVSSGVSSYTANLARSMSAAGASVMVVAPSETEAPNTHSDGDVTVLRTGPRGAFALARAIRQAIALRPRVIHLQHEVFLFGGLSSVAATPPAMRLLSSRGPRTVVTVHQAVDVEDITLELMRIHRLPLPVTAVRMAMSTYHRLVASAGAAIVHEAPLARHFPNGVVIPHGVESPFTPTRGLARQRLGMTDEGRLVVLCFGFVAPYKGLEHVLAAAAEVPEVLVVVAGGVHPRHGTTYAESLRQRWGDVAHFTGWVPEEDIGRWHAAADVALFCYPAPHSSSGALALALAHRTPFLASEPLARCMGLPQQMAVSLDHVGLVNRLRGLASDRGTLAALRRSGARFAESRSWPEVARLHLQLYEEVCRRSPAEPPEALLSSGRIRAR